MDIGDFLDVKLHEPTLAFEVLRSLLRRPSIYSIEFIEQIKELICLSMMDVVLYALMETVVAHRDGGESIVSGEIAEFKAMNSVEQHPLNGIHSIR